MEAHPIPQNVTSFQFRLVGDMTLKQFVYLASGLGLAYLLFVTTSASYPFLTWPLIVIFSALGVAFAFLPIGSRPLDYWLAAFLKAVYSPTKREWKKDGKTFKEDPLFKSRMMMVAPTIQPNQPLSASQQNQPISWTPTELPSPEKLDKTVELARQAQALQLKIIQAERQLNQIKTEATKSTPIPVDYQAQVTTILEDLTRLINQASQIKQDLAKVQGEKVEPIKPKITIKLQPLEKTKERHVALTTFPNIINGIVKDSQGNLLEGVVVVIYDKEGLPVRALKTNKLGQFSGATPLPNGTYNLELEKEGFSFDTLQIELDNLLLPPLSITAKIIH